MEAQEVLRDVQLTRERTADRLVTPRWYHPTLGLAAAAVCLAVLMVGASVVHVRRHEPPIPLALAVLLSIGWLIAYESWRGRNPVCTTRGTTARSSDAPAQ